MSQRLVIGTRGSALALKQTNIVIDALKAVDPTLEAQVRVIQTHGDVNQNPIPLDTIGKGWFTEEIEAALISGEIDLAVHSLKDMAEDMPQGLCIGAYLPREDARDALITKDGRALAALPPGAVVGTDSARRQVQMRAMVPGIEMRSLRGNILTRLQKLIDEPYDAIVLAVAGLKRLGLEDKISHTFSIEEMVPAPGQGILAVQSRTSGEARALLESINDEEAALVARVERSFSKAVGGGCKAPTGAYASREAGECVLVGMVVGESGRIYVESMRAPWSGCEHLGEELAHKLLALRV